MTGLRVMAMPSETVRALQAGRNDANGQPSERHTTDGSGVPCRHCLTDVPQGEPFLLLAYRPFPEAQPYAEIGPIFLHANLCERYDETAGMPAMFLDRESIMIRGYGDDDRIVEGTGQVISTADIAASAAALLERPDVVYIHVRSASNNCYQCRIERADHRRLV